MMVASNGYAGLPNAPSEAEFVNIPLLPNEQLLVDENCADVVFVFPRGNNDAVGISADHVIQDPLASCMKAFRHRWCEGVELLDEEFEQRMAGPMAQTEYVNLLRKKILEVVRLSGFRATSFESIDHDDVFVRLRLEREGDHIRGLAKRFGYELPLNNLAYKKACAWGKEALAREWTHSSRDRPMKNFEGFVVRRHLAWKEDRAEYLGEFREVDTVRLIYKQLDRWMNLEEMVAQKVVSRFFTAAKHSEVLDLSKDFGNLCLFWRPPPITDMAVREYFGEAIASFFMWFSFKTRWLSVLAVIGLVEWLVFVLGQEKEINLNFVWRRYARIGMAVVIIIWSMGFQKFFKRQASRAKQLWGMQDHVPFTLERSGYDPSIDGVGNAVLVVASILYCCLFMACAFFFTSLEQKKDLKEYAPYATTILIRVGTYLWGSIAPILVDWQNHRTMERHNEHLTWLLASVKLFVAFYPFAKLAFADKFLHTVCGANLQEVASAIYGDVDSGNWPVAPDPNLPWLQAYAYQKQNETCVYGCHPRKCVYDVYGNHNCYMNCAEELKNSVTAYYVTHALTTVLFLLIPIFITRWKVRREIDMSKGESDLDEIPYSFLQFQAKCNEVARYRYREWGGSFVEDFLDQSIGFALLVCFGIMSPLLCVLAFVAGLVEYRLLAYRMTNVTSRPFPAGAQGIGAWDKILNTIPYAAVFCNVGLAVFVMEPMRTWPLYMQWGVLFVMEHTLLAMVTLVKSVIPDQPSDVSEIGEFNDTVEMTLRSRLGEQKLCAKELQDMSAIDVAVEAAGLSSTGHESCEE